MRIVTNLSVFSSDFLIYALNIRLKLPYRTDLAPVILAVVLARALSAVVGSVVCYMGGGGSGGGGGRIRVF